MLTESCRCAFCKFLELGNSVVVATQMGTEHCFWIRSDPLIPIYAVETADLILITFQSAK